MNVEREYHRPTSLAQALDLLAGEPGDSRCLAGGTDLLVKLKQRRLMPPRALVSLRSVPELGGIEIGDRVRIGAGVTISELLDHAVLGALFPGLIEAGRVLGSTQIRNTATVGGNLVNASPAADLAPPLLVHDAKLLLQSAAGSRELPLAGFFVGPGLTRLAPGEILTGVLVDRPVAGVRSGFLRLGRVKMDLAIVSVACALELREKVCMNVRLAAGAVAPIPLRLTATEQLLEGQTLDGGVVEQAADQAAEEVSPIDDLRSSANYRRTLVRVFTARLLRAHL